MIYIYIYNISYTVRKNLLLTSLSTATTKKPTPTFCCGRPLQFTFCYCNPTHSPQNGHLDKCKYRQIQIFYTSKIYSKY